MNKEELKKRLIELLEQHEDAINETEDDCDWGIDCRDYDKVVESFIANGVTIRERGEWIRKTPYSEPECSQCGRTPKMLFGYLPEFCPHCGVDMRD